jgi:hypothetical protein
MMWRSLGSAFKQEFNCRVTPIGRGFRRPEPYVIVHAQPRQVEPDDSSNSNNIGGT